MTDVRGSDWGEGERVFGPPGGTYDADWVAAAAVAAGTPPATAHRLAVDAWELLRTGTPPGRLAAALGPEGDGVARAAVEFCALYRVDLG